MAMAKEILTVRQTPHEKKMDWMEEAIQEGALSKLPHRTTQEQWEKQQDIGITYTFGDVTYEDLGRIHGCTGKNIRQLNKKFVINLWENSSPPLQAQHPLAEIPFAKPLGQIFRERRSEVQGGFSLKVRDLVRKGITDPKQIKDTLGISTEALVGTRRILRGWGIDIPRTQSIKETFERIENEKDDKKLQELLDSFSASSLEYFLYKDSSHETLTTASAIANKKGFHAHTKSVRLIAETIKQAKIPIRPTVRLRKNGKLLGSYYIVYAKHAERIAEALRSDPELQKFR